MVITLFLHSCSSVNHLKAPNVMFDSGFVVENNLESRIVDINKEAAKCIHYMTC